MKNMKELRRLEKELDEDLENVEKWILARRKFFIKLFWVVLIIVVILIASNLLLD